MLKASPCNVRSEISLRDFREFVSVIEGDALAIKNDNFKGLSQLCDEFGFRDLAEQVSQVRESADLKEEGTQEDSEAWKHGSVEARKRLSALEGRMQQRDKEIAVLQCCGANCRGKRRYMNRRLTCFLDDLRGLRRN
jgi:hypothetical protein